ncbi:hypothetical protein [Kordia sp.]|uniref:hypothetical protein n=1 Tax=Kordia sp. TaxID=1965332 RepID=UPI0025C01237|nr:hypothetical protein [Kordia sp.]MCH2196496.1 hypothetical protein [Kordia sp.]
MLLSVVVFVGCTDLKKDKENTTDAITLGDVLDLSKLEKVTMYNNSGKFELTAAQRGKLKKELAKMEYEKSIAVKLGSIYIELIIDGKKCGITSGTHKKHIEVHKSSLTNTKGLPAERDWLYFKTNGVNFDNYKPKK